MTSGGTRYGEASSSSSVIGSLRGGDHDGDSLFDVEGEEADGLWADSAAAAAEGVAIEWPSNGFA